MAHTKVGRSTEKGDAKLEMSEFSVFKGLSAKEIGVFESSSELRAYPKGEILFNFGRKPDGIFCVKSGVVKVYKPLVSGEKVLVQVGAPGDVLGAKALLRDSTHKILLRPRQMQR